MSRGILYNGHLREPSEKIHTFCQTFSSIAVNTCFYDFRSVTAEIPTPNFMNARRTLKPPPWLGINDFLTFFKHPDKDHSDTLPPRNALKVVEYMRECEGKLNLYNHQLSVIKQ